jgi:flagella basal body P-ring formation protein FlgA
MRCCAEAVRRGALAVLFTLAGATSAFGQATSLVDRLAAEVAARWGVDPGDIVVEWSSPDLAAALPEDAGLELVGGGNDGVWFVDVATEEGTTRLRARAGLAYTGKVAAHDLERGVEIVAADIALQSTTRWGPPGRETEGVEPGWVTRRRIVAGQPLVAPAVARPLAVRPGDDVQIVYASGPVELVLAGRAAGSGAVGERVAVRAETGKRLEGVIVSNGRIRIENGAGSRR